EWKRWVTFGVSRAAAMAIDGLEATRPIEFEVRNPHDCVAMFDLLTYEKGASTLRMLEQHLGAPVFREGVRLYLERHRFANAETTDLWKALGDAARLPIPAVMDGWISRPGHPLVTIAPEGRGLKLSQRRFSYLGGETASGQRWRIPIVLRASVKPGYVERRLLLDGDPAEVALPAKADWVVVNSGGSGVYRVRSPPPPPKNLPAPAAKLAPTGRFTPGANGSALARPGLIPATDFLDLTARFTAETDRNVWSALTMALA